MAYWGKPEVDLFATRKKCKSSKFLFVMPRSSTSGGGRSAEPLDLQPGLCISCPSPHSEDFSKISRRHVLILVAPFWPKRPWFTTLLKLADPAPSEATPQTRPSFSGTSTASTNCHIKTISVATEEEVLRSKRLSEGYTNITSELKTSHQSYLWQNLEKM